MITVALFNASVVFYAYIARYKRTEFWLQGSFILIFLFLALRYDFGNDYNTYLDGFININRLTTIDYFDESWGFEPGWIFLCRLFAPLGFFAMTAVLALLNCFVYYRFVRKYVPSTYYWFAVFLYVFSPGFMLIHSSAMRQSIAITLFVFSIDYIYKKDALRYFLCICLASLFHTSALILLPVYLLGVLNWRINRISSAIIFSIFILLFMYGEYLVPDLKNFISVYFKRYEFYQQGADLGTGIGLMFYSVIFALVLFYAKYQDSEFSLLFKIVIISYFIMPLGLLIMMFSRVSMYFQPVTIAVFPVVLLAIKDRFLRNFILLMIVLVTLYSFYGFFHSDVWSKKFGTYSTIFSAPEIY